MNRIALLSMVAVLAGCFEDESSGPPYPPINARQLVGCWRSLAKFDSCDAFCFDRAGTFYNIASFDYAGKLQLAEDSGTYSVQLNTIPYFAVLRTTTGKNERSDFHLNLTIIRDTLQSIDPLGSWKLSRTHADSLPCRMKAWSQFKKPANWDSLILPY